MQAFFYRRALWMILVLFLAVAGFMAWNKVPWCDEGWYGGPAYNIAHHGSAGTPNLYTSRLPGVREHTYWENPGFIVALALWTKVVGFDILRVRALNILLGIAVLVLWYAALRALRVKELTCLLAVLFLGVDYLFVMDATYGRADIMSLALTCGAYAAFLRWRESDLGRALLIANFSAMLAGLTHPNAGLLTLLGLGVLIWQERSRLRWTHLWLSLIPYALGLVVWGVYIAAAPQDFVSQIRNNSDTRFQLFLHPWQAISAEIGIRYIRAYGLGPHSPGTPRLVIVKALILIMEVAGLAACLAIRELRNHPGFRVLLTIFALYFVFYTLLEGSRTTYYLVWILPFWMTFTAAAVNWAVERGKLQALAALALAAMMILVQGAAIWTRARQSPAMVGFRDSVAFLKEHGAPNPRIFASIEFGYGLGFEPTRYTDDVSLGDWSGYSPEYVVIEARWQDDVKNPPPDARPWSFESSRRLKQNCPVVFSRPYYEIHHCQWDR